MDTISKISVIGPGAKKTAHECTDIIYKYDKLLSVSNPDSEIYKFNHSDTGIILSEEVFNIITSCESFYKDTDGLFDITVGALSQLWKTALISQKLPDENNIQKVLPLTNYSSLIFDKNNLSVTKTIKNQQISLGASAKGYISDRIAENLKNTSIKGAVIDLGGNIYVCGTKQNGNTWNIGIQDPNNTSLTIGTVSLDEGFVITSGDYQRYMDKDGIRYHHITDPKTGYPAKSDLRSVTVISNNGFTGDSLSTACFLSGLNKGIELLKKYNAMGIFVTNDNNIYYSKELSFTVHNDHYSYFSY